MGMSVKRAAYHGYEAKMMAEDSPHVNDHLDMLIANKDQHWMCSTHRPDLGAGSPVSLSDLNDWFQKYGIRDTSELDK